MLVAVGSSLLQGDDGVAARRYVAHGVLSQRLHFYTRAGILVIENCCTLLTSMQAY